MRRAGGMRVLRRVVWVVCEKKGGSLVFDIAFGCALRRRSDWFALWTERTDHPRAII